MYNITVAIEIIVAILKTTRSTHETALSVSSIPASLLRKYNTHKDGSRCKIFFPFLVKELQKEPLGRFFARLNYTTPAAIAFHLLQLYA